MSSGGRIPDAAMIHAARKRRQLAREMGNDYIAIESNSNTKKWVFCDMFKEEKYVIDLGSECIDKTLKL